MAKEFIPQVSQMLFPSGVRTQIFLALTQAGSHRSVNRLEHLLSFDAVSETPWEISQVDKGSGGVGKLP